MNIFIDTNLNMIYEKENLEDFVNALESSFTDLRYENYEKLIERSSEIEQNTSLKQRYSVLLYAYSQKFAYDLPFYEILFDMSIEGNKTMFFHILQARNFAKAKGFIKAFKAIIKTRGDVGELIASKLDELKLDSEKVRETINNSEAKDMDLINHLSCLNKAIERLNYLYEKFFGIRYLLLAALFLAICLLISLGEYGFDKLLKNPFKWSSSLNSDIKAHLAQIILLLLAFVSIPIFIKKVIPIIRPVFTDICPRLFGDPDISCLDSVQEQKQ